ncbi:MAG: ATP synthase subunit b, sodium ion specific [Elusimicrobia bacterium]|nr:ATP synthase subunit b, sodium ion specific [Elusimicrobiota bacterium]
MDKLLNPDLGLIITTIVTFALLVLILKKAAWKPILEGINQREGKIRGDLERAEKAQAEAEALRLKYESQLTEAQRTIQEMVNQARNEAARARADLLTAAKEESERTLEKGRRDLAGETERLKGELQKEVAGLSMAIAEKIVNRSLDARVQEDVLKDALKSVTGAN